MSGTLSAMAAAADSFADPLVARQATVAVAYHESHPDRDLWTVLDAGFSRVSVLPRTEWSPPSSTTTYVIPELHCAPLHHSHPTFDFPNLPVNWYRQPYVHLLLVSIEPGDASTTVEVVSGARPVKLTPAEIIKQRVKDWVEEMSAKNIEWLVLYLPAPPTGKQSRSLMDTFRMLTGTQQFGGTSLGASFYANTFAALRQESGAQRKHWHRFLRLDHFEVYRRELAAREAQRRNAAAADAAARRRAADAAAGGASAGIAASGSPGIVGARPSIRSLDPSALLGMRGGSGVAAGAASSDAASAGSAGSAGAGVVSPRKPPLVRALTARFAPGADGAAAGAGGAGAGSAAEEALPPPPPLDAESASEIGRQWAELRARLHASCYDALSARVRLHDDEVRKLHEQRYYPGWNYAPFFCLKESLAFVFAQIRLPQEALRCYDEAEAAFHLLSAVPERLTAQLSAAARLAARVGVNVHGAAGAVSTASAGAGAASGSSAHASDSGSGSSSRPLPSSLAGAPSSFYSSSSTALRVGISSGAPVPAAAAASSAAASGSAASSAASGIPVLPAGFGPPVSAIGPSASIAGVSRRAALDIAAQSVQFSEMLQAMRTVRGLSDLPMLAPYPPSLIAAAMRGREGVSGASSSSSSSIHAPATREASFFGSGLRTAPAPAAPPAAPLQSCLPLESHAHLLDLTHKPYRQLIFASHCSLFDFRHYLFARQCQLLQIMRRDGEIASRALPFIRLMSNMADAYACIGAVSPQRAQAWLFCACLDIVESCTKRSRAHRLAAAGITGGGRNAAGAAASAATRSLSSSSAAADTAAATVAGGSAGSRANSNESAPGAASDALILSPNAAGASASSAGGSAARRQGRHHYGSVDADGESSDPASAMAAAADSALAAQGTPSSQLQAHGRRSDGSAGRARAGSSALFASSSSDAASNGVGGAADGSGDGAPSSRASSGPRLPSIAENADLSGRAGLPVSMPDGHGIAAIAEDDVDSDASPAPHRTRSRLPELTGDAHGASLIPGRQPPSLDVRFGAGGMHPAAHALALPDAPSTPVLGSIAAAAGAAAQLLMDDGSDGIVGVAVAPDIAASAIAAVEGDGDTADDDDGGDTMEIAQVAQPAAPPPLPPSLGGSLEDVVQSAPSPTAAANAVAAIAGAQAADGTVAKPVSGTNLSATLAVGGLVVSGMPGAAVPATVEATVGAVQPAQPPAPLPRQESVALTPIAPITGGAPPSLLVPSASGGASTAPVGQLAGATTAAGQAAPQPSAPAATSAMSTAAASTTSTPASSRDDVLLSRTMCVLLMTARAQLTRLAWALLRHDVTAPPDVISAPAIAAMHLPTMTQASHSFAAAGASTAIMPAVAIGSAPSLPSAAALAREGVVASEASRGGSIASSGSLHASPFDFASSEHVLTALQRRAQVAAAAAAAAVASPTAAHAAVTSPANVGGSGIRSAMAATLRTAHSAAALALSTALSSPAEADWLFAVLTASAARQHAAVGRRRTALLLDVQHAAVLIRHREFAAALPLLQSQAGRFAEAGWHGLYVWCLMMIACCQLGLGAQAALMRTCLELLEPRLRHAAAGAWGAVFRAKLRKRALRGGNDASLVAHGRSVALASEIVAMTGAGAPSAGLMYPRSAVGRPLSATTSFFVPGAAGSEPAAVSAAAYSFGAALADAASSGWSLDFGRRLRNIGSLPLQSSSSTAGAAGGLLAALPQATIEQLAAAATAAAAGSASTRPRRTTSALGAGPLGIPPSEASAASPTAAASTTALVARSRRNPVGNWPFVPLPSALALPPPLVRSMPGLPSFLAALCDAAALMTSAGQRSEPIGAAFAALAQAQAAASGTASTAKLLGLPGSALVAWVQQLHAGVKAVNAALDAPAAAAVTVGSGGGSGSGSGSMPALLPPSAFYSTWAEPGGGQSALTATLAPPAQLAGAPVAAASAAAALLAAAAGVPVASVAAAAGGLPFDSAAATAGFNGMSSSSHRMWVTAAGELAALGACVDGYHDEGAALAAVAAAVSSVFGGGSGGSDAASSSSAASALPASSSAEPVIAGAASRSAAITTGPEPALAIVPSDATAGGIIVAGPSWSFPPAALLWAPVWSASTGSAARARLPFIMQRLQMAVQACFYLARLADAAAESATRYRQAQAAVAAYAAAVAAHQEGRERGAGSGDVRGRLMLGSPLGGSLPHAPHTDIPLLTDGFTTAGGALASHNQYNTQASPAGDNGLWSPSDPRAAAASMAGSIGGGQGQVPRIARGLSAPADLSTAADAAVASFDASSTAALPSAGGMHSVALQASAASASAGGRAGAVPQRGGTIAGAGGLASAGSFFGGSSTGAHGHSAAHANAGVAPWDSSRSLSGEDTLSPVAVAGAGVLSGREAMTPPPLMHSTSAPASATPAAAAGDSGFGSSAPPPLGPPPPPLPPFKPTSQLMRPLFTSCVALVGMPPPAPLPPAAPIVGAENICGNGCSQPDCGYCSTGGKRSRRSSRQQRQQHGDASPPEAPQHAAQPFEDGPEVWLPVGQLTLSHLRALLTPRPVIAGQKMSAIVYVSNDSLAPLKVDAVEVHCALSASGADGPSGPAAAAAAVAAAARAAVSAAPAGAHAAAAGQAPKAAVGGPSNPSSSPLDVSVMHDVDPALLPVDPNLWVPVGPSRAAFHAAALAPPGIQQAVYPHAAVWAKTAGGAPSASVSVVTGLDTCSVTGLGPGVGMGGVNLMMPQTGPNSGAAGTSGAASAGPGASAVNATQPGGAGALSAASNRNISSGSGSGAGGQGQRSGAGGAAAANDDISDVASTGSADTTATLSALPTSGGRAYLTYRSGAEAAASAWGAADGSGAGSTATPAPVGATPSGVPGMPKPPSVPLVFSSATHMSTTFLHYCSLGSAWTAASVAASAVPTAMAAGGSPATGLRSSGGGSSRRRSRAASQPAADDTAVLSPGASTSGGAADAAASGASSTRVSFSHEMPEGLSASAAAASASLRASRNSGGADAAPHLSSPVTRTQSQQLMQRRSIGHSSAPVERAALTQPLGAQPLLPARSDGRLTLQPGLNVLVLSGIAPPAGTLRVTSVRLCVGPVPLAPASASGGAPSGSYALQLVDQTPLLLQGYTLPAMTQLARVATAAALARGLRARARAAAWLAHASEKSRLADGTLHEPVRFCAGDAAAAALAAVAAVTGDAMIPGDGASFPGAADATCPDAAGASGRFRRILPRAPVVQQLMSRGGLAVTPARPAPQQPVASAAASGSAGAAAAAMQSGAAARAGAAGAEPSSNVLASPTARPAAGSTATAAGQGSRLGAAGGTSVARGGGGARGAPSGRAAVAAAAATAAAASVAPPLAVLGAPTAPPALPLSLSTFSRPQPPAWLRLLRGLRCVPADAQAEASLRAVLGQPAVAVAPARRRLVAARKLFAQMAATYHSPAAAVTAATLAGRVEAVSAASGGGSSSSFLPSSEEAADMQALAALLALPAPAESGSGSLMSHGASWDGLDSSSVGRSVDARRRRRTLARLNSRAGFGGGGSASAGNSPVGTGGSGVPRASTVRPSPFLPVGTVDSDVEADGAFTDEDDENEDVDGGETATDSDADGGDAVGVDSDADTPRTGKLLRRLSGANLHAAAGAARRLAAGRTGVTASDDEDDDDDDAGGNAQAMAGVTALSFDAFLGGAGASEAGTGKPEQKTAAAAPNGHASAAQKRAQAAAQRVARRAALAPLAALASHVSLPRDMLRLALPAPCFPPGVCTGDVQPHYRVRGLREESVFWNAGDGAADWYGDRERCDRAGLDYLPAAPLLASLQLSGEPGRGERVSRGSGSRSTSATPRASAREKKDAAATDVQLDAAPPQAAASAAMKQKQCANPWSSHVATSLLGASPHQLRCPLGASSSAGQSRKKGGAASTGADERKPGEVLNSLPLALDLASLDPLWFEALESAWVGSFTVQPRPAPVHVWIAAGATGVTPALHQLPPQPPKKQKRAAATAAVAGANGGATGADKTAASTAASAGGKSASSSAAVSGGPPSVAPHPLPAMVGTRNHLTFLVTPGRGCVAAVTPSGTGAASSAGPSAGGAACSPYNTAAAPALPASVLQPQALLPEDALMSDNKASGTATATRSAPLLPSIAAARITLSMPTAARLVLPGSGSGVTSLAVTSSATGAAGGAGSPGRNIADKTKESTAVAGRRTIRVQAWLLTASHVAAHVYSGEAAHLYRAANELQTALLPAHAQPVLPARISALPAAAREVLAITAAAAGKLSGDVIDAGGAGVQPCSLVQSVLRSQLPAAAKRVMTARLVLEDGDIATHIDSSGSSVTKAGERWQPPLAGPLAAVRDHIAIAAALPDPQPLWLDATPCADGSALIIDVPFALPYGRYLCLSVPYIARQQRRGAPLSLLAGGSGPTAGAQPSAAGAAPASIAASETTPAGPASAASMTAAAGAPLHPHRSFFVGSSAGAGQSTPAGPGSAGTGSGAGGAALGRLQLLTNRRGSAPSAGPLAVAAAGAAATAGSGPANAALPSVGGRLLTGQPQASPSGPAGMGSATAAGTPAAAGAAPAVAVAPVLMSVAAYGLSTGAAVSSGQPAAASAASAASAPTPAAAFPSLHSVGGAVTLRAPLTGVSEGSVTGILTSPSPLHSLETLDSVGSLDSASTSASGGSRNADASAAAGGASTTITAAASVPAPRRSLTSMPTAPAGAAAASTASSALPQLATVLAAPPPSLRGVVVAGTRISPGLVAGAPLATSITAANALAVFAAGRSALSAPGARGCGGSTLIGPTLVLAPAPAGAFAAAAPAASVTALTSVGPSPLMRGLASTQPQQLLDLAQLQQFGGSTAGPAAGAVAAGAAAAHGRSLQPKSSFFAPAGALSAAAAAAAATASGLAGAPSSGVDHAPTSASTAATSDSSLIAAALAAAAGPSSAASVPLPTEIGFAWHRYAPAPAQVDRFAILIPQPRLPGGPPKPVPLPCLFASGGASGAGGSGSAAFDGAATPILQPPLSHTLWISVSVDIVTPSPLQVFFPSAAAAVAAAAVATASASAAATADAARGAGHRGSGAAASSTHALQLHGLSSPAAAPTLMALPSAGTPFDATNGPTPAHSLSRHMPAAPAFSNSDVGAVDTRSLFSVADPWLPLPVYAGAINVAGVLPRRPVIAGSSTGAGAGAMPAVTLLPAAPSATAAIAAGGTALLPARRGSAVAAAAAAGAGIVDGSGRRISVTAALAGQGDTSARRSSEADGLPEASSAVSAAAAGQAAPALAPGAGMGILMPIRNAAALRPGAAPATAGSELSLVPMMQLLAGYAVAAPQNAAVGPPASSSAAIDHASGLPPKARRTSARVGAEAVGISSAADSDDSGDDEAGAKRHSIDADTNADADAHAGGDGPEAAAAASARAKQLQQQQQQQQYGTRLFAGRRFVDMGPARVAAAEAKTLPPPPAGGAAAAGTTVAGAGTVGTAASHYGGPAPAHRRRRSRKATEDSATGVGRRRSSRTADGGASSSQTKRDALPSPSSSSASPSDSDGSSSSSEGEGDEHLQAGAVTVQQSLLVFLPQPIQLRSYGLAAPRTSGWSLAFDGSRFLIGKDMRPDALPPSPALTASLQVAQAHTLAGLTSSAASAGAPSAAAALCVEAGFRSSLTAWLSRLAESASLTPYAMGFAYRFRRAISASDAITARFSAEYAVAAQPLVLAVRKRKGSAGAAAASAATSDASAGSSDGSGNDVLAVLPTTLEGVAMAHMLAQLARAAPPQAFSAVAATAAVGAAGSGPSSDIAVITAAADAHAAAEAGHKDSEANEDAHVHSACAAASPIAEAFALFDEPLLRAPTA